MGVELRFEPDTSTFDGMATCGEKPYRISLADFEENDPERATLLATQLTQWLEDNISSVKEFAAAQLVGLKNSLWLDENEARVNETDFRKVIALQGVLAFAEGGFEVFFTDHDLFGGHGIKVDADKSFTLESADIVG